MSADERLRDAGLRVLVDAEGREATVRLLAVLRFEERDYALIAEAGDDDEPEVVVFGYRDGAGGGHFDQVEDAEYERVVAHCERWLDPAGDSHAHLLALATEAWEAGRTSEAREALLVAAGLRTPLAERVTVARLALSRGAVELRRGSYREAQRAFVRALREAKTAGDLGVELEARAGVVETLARRGRAGSARAALGRALARVKKRAAREIPALEYARGCVELFDKGARAALGGFAGAAAPGAGGEDPGERALFARVALAAGRTDVEPSEGTDPYEAMGAGAVALSSRGLERAAVDAILLHGRAYYAHGRFAEAGGAFVAAGERAKAAGDAWGEATALRWQAWCHLRLGSPMRASKHFLEADRAARALDDRGAMARCALGLAWTLANAEAHREALDLLKPAIGWLREVGDGPGRVEVYRARAELWALLGRAKNAKRAAKKAAKLAALAGASLSRLASPEAWPALG